MLVVSISLRDMCVYDNYIYMCESKKKDHWNAV